MRKYLIFVFLLVILIPINYNATSGALASGSIKTCPNGKLYGKHTNHWHKAVKRGNRYYASGSALKKDPCPPKSGNNDLKSLINEGFIEVVPGGAAAKAGKQDRQQYTDHTFHGVSSSFSSSRSTLARYSVSQVSKGTPASWISFARSFPT